VARKAGKTPSGAEAAPEGRAGSSAPPRPVPVSTEVEPTTKKSRSKLPLILLGGAAVAGGAIAVSSHGSAGESGATTQPPTAMTLLTTMNSIAPGSYNDYAVVTNRDGKVEVNLTSVSPPTALLGLVIYSNCTGTGCSETNNDSNPSARTISASLAAGGIVVRVHDFPRRNTSAVAYSLTVQLR
jgi:hypothetical protein